MIWKDKSNFVCYLIILAPERQKQVDSMSYTLAWSTEWNQIYSRVYRETLSQNTEKKAKKAKMNNQKMSISIYEEIAETIISLTQK